MCLAMNPDKLKDDEISASSSNRNFIGRQGSPRGTHPFDEPSHGGSCCHCRQGCGCPRVFIGGKMSLPTRALITGRGIPVMENDIDTDRIIPARFMKTVTFEGLGQYAFYDARFNEDGSKKGASV
jgi:hypothetical protein